MSLQYVEPTTGCFPIGIFAKSGGGGNQRPRSMDTGQGAGKPSTKKTGTKAAKKKKK